MGVRNDAFLRGLDSMGERDDIRRFESIYGVFSSDQIERLIGSSNSKAYRPHPLLFRPAGLLHPTP